MHSIIGNHCWTLSLGRSDGVVPVKNATESRAITERFVDATHSGVKEDAESVEEFFSILELHMNQCHHSQVLPIPTQSFDLESASLRGSVTTPEFLR